MKFILATKEGMTRIFGDDGRARAGTILIASPVTVTAVKTAEGKDGYAAVQVGQGSRKVKNITKPVLGHTKGKGYEAIREFRLSSEQEAGAVGDTIDASVFAVGDTVQVSGLTKGKGFAGVVKRHGFHGVGASHGAHRNHRKPGSIGACATPGRVFKGLKMAGHMGAEQVTTQNLTVHAVDVAKGVILVKGAVPGPKGALVVLRSAAKGA